MRLRLSVQRHTLPPANVLWSVPDNNSTQAYTIARLLEDVNNIVPLEAENWGLEDYAVEVGGFECLHFSPVAQSLKDDDQVLIRPLLTAEIRARTLSGRYQISDAGQHLVDGVPFGRPYLRKPNRPAVRIPPRKRQRLLEDTVGGNDDSQVVGLLTANGEVAHGEDNSGVLSKDKLRQDEQGTHRRGRNGKIVHFEESLVDQSDDDEDVDEDFAPGGESETSDVSMQDSSADDSEDESDDSSEVSDTSSASDNDSSSSSGTDSDSGESTGPEVLKFKRTIANQKPPGKGFKATKRRNDRRRDSAGLKKLKDLDILPATAQLADFRQYRRTIEHETKKQSATSLNTKTTPSSSTSRKRKRGAENVSPQTTPDGVSELELRKQELMAQVAPESPKVEEPSPAEPASKLPQPKATEEPSPAEFASKRLRPNVSAINRILSRQTRPIAKQSPRTETVPTEESEAPPDPDFWKSKINLSAFECWEEEFTLSAPPFPFKQHWDPASKLIREKAKDQRQKKKGGKPAPDTKANSDESGDTIELDYGDAPVMEKADTDTAAIESQLLQDVQIAAKSDLPPLPDDVESLPSLSQSDIKIGAIIVFKLLDLNPSTMNPEISGFKTAVVQEEGDSGNGAGVIGLKLAERDQLRKEKKFDRNGNRIYELADNFHMDDEEEEEDGGLLHHQFHELLEAKLLKAA